MVVIMERNEVLIDKVLTYLKEHPKEWEQGSWVTDCGTQACFAGHAMLLSGYGIGYATVHQADETQEGHDCDYWDCKKVAYFVNPLGHRVRDEDLEANRLLGLTEDEGDEIYYRQFSNVEDLREHLNNIRED